MDLLKRADFSKETDLKERLASKIIKAKVVPFPQRMSLSDDDVELIFAAGDTRRQSEHSGFGRTDMSTESIFTDMHQNNNGQFDD